MSFDEYISLFLDRKICVTIENDPEAAKRFASELGSTYGIRGYVTNSETAEATKYIDMLLHPNERCGMWPCIYYDGENTNKIIGCGSGVAGAIGGVNVPAEEIMAAYDRDALNTDKSSTFSTVF